MHFIFGCSFPLSFPLHPSSGVYKCGLCFRFTPPLIMLKEVGKGLLVLMSSAIAVPYAVAAICNVLYAGPHTRKKLKRAFHPRRVFYLNYRVLLKLLDIQHLPVLIKWKWFYSYADRYRLLKVHLTHCLVWIFCLRLFSHIVVTLTIC